MKATDAGISPRSSYATLDVEVIDTNDHPPVIALHLAGDVTSGDSDHVILTRTSSSGDEELAVGHVSVSDDDSDENGRVTCTVSATSGHRGNNDVNVFFRTRCTSACLGQKWIAP